MVAPDPWWNFFTDMQPVILVMLGWLMGLLSPGIVEHFHRHYRRRDLMQAVADEMLGLQYTMIVAAIRIRQILADLPDEFLDRALPIIENYCGENRKDMISEFVRTLRAVPADKRKVTLEAYSEARSGLVLSEYSLPLFVTQMADLAICPLSFQRAVLNVHYHLDLFNQHVRFAQSQFNLTFSNLDQADSQAVKENLDRGYHEVADRAVIVVRAIDRLNNTFISWATKARGWWVWTWFKHSDRLQSPSRH